MKKLNLKETPTLTKRHGDQAEAVARFTLTGELKLGDCTPYWVSGDIGSMQVKSSGATVCHGYDIKAHIERDAATEYGYVIYDFSAMYVMTPAEWANFVDNFSYETYDTKTNEPKLRLNKETAYMREWLEVKVSGRNYGAGRYWLG